MCTKLQYRACRLLALLLLFFAPLDISAEINDQHSVEAIVAALKSPIPPDAIKEAREIDDRIMTEGQIEEQRIYLVTDERLNRTNNIVRKLLEAMGEDPQNWVVRVLDTDPKMTNAFVTGGKYIYVYTGLIEEATSDDELAFVLSHELGHSLLKHMLRAKEDVTSTIAGLATLGALLSHKYRDDFMDFAKLATASYSRIDEEEADAIAVAIAQRSAFNPLRGADFFSRSNRQQDKTEKENQQLLEQMREEVEQAQATCKQSLQLYNSSLTYQTQENSDKVNAICSEAENKRIRYNQMAERFNLSNQQQGLDSFFSTHPENQNRIAAIAALADYIKKRRDLQSLSRYQQSYRVMAALKQVNSIVLEPPKIPADATRASGELSPKLPTNSGLPEQLMQLKLARKQGLITEIEYETKRQQILNRF